MTTIATDAQIEQLRRRAVNDTTREIAVRGIRLTHEQADDLGEEVLDWMVSRLELGRVSDEDGIAFYADEEPPTATHAQIVALRAEAAEHGDTAQRILCDMAIDGEDSQYDEDCLDADGRPDYSGGGHSADELGDIQRALRMTRDEARVACAIAIADARAQE